MNLLFVAAAVALLGYLAVEAARHEQRLRRIRVRIHVNGTRGKTSVTRLLTAALRAAGWRTVGKVTGDEPLLILPDGTERRISRRGPARIQEQMWLVRQAAALGAEAIVVECMALAPELQQVSEERMLRSTLGVITNVRPDHHEVMGENLEEVAEALARTIPRDGVLVTADRRFFGRWAERAAARGTRAVLATREGSREEGAPPGVEAFGALGRAVDSRSGLARCGGFTPRGQAGTVGSRHKAAPTGDEAGAVAGAEGEDAELLAPAAEHRAIVRTVCEALGLTPPTGVERAVAPDVVRCLEEGGRRVFFVNAFSANDPVSTALLERSATAGLALPERRVALLNNRADRPRRMLAFVEALRGDSRYAAIALGGDLASLAARRLRVGGRETWALRAKSPAQIIAEIAGRLGGGDLTIVGMGNAKGLGLACGRFCDEKGDRCR